MKYIVAGACALLAVLSGILGQLLTENYHEQSTTDNNIGEVVMPLKTEEQTRAASFFVIVRSIPFKEWVLIALSSVLIGVMVLRLQEAQVRLIASGRLLATALLLLSAMVVDKNVHRIPNKLVLAMMASGAIFLVMEYIWANETFKNQLLSSIIGFAAFLVLFYVMAQLTKGGIGMGDVKLIAGEGWMVGFVITLYATLFSLLICSFIAVFLLTTKKKNSNDHIPFGPFLFFGYVLSVYGKLEIQ